MDILSDTLEVLRTGRPMVTRTDAHGPWALKYQPISGAGFHVVMEGRCRLLRPDGEPLTLGPGDIVFLRRGSGHTMCDPDSPHHEPVDFAPHRLDGSSPIGQFTVEGPGPRTVLVCGAYKIDADHRHPLFADLPEIIHLPAAPGRYPVLRSAIDQLCAEFRSPQPGSDAIVTALVDLLLLHILRSWYAELPKDQTCGWGAALTDQAIAPALKAIHDAPGDPWTVESLAARTGLSRAAFARRFAGVVGVPPLTYLTNWRMATAARLLRESPSTVSTIAQRTGYTSEFAFAKAFKRHFGSPPGSYRKPAMSAQGAMVPRYDD